MYDYDTRFYPPAPVVPIEMSSPGPANHLTTPALLDSGSDITVIPMKTVTGLKLRPVAMVRSRGLSETVEDSLVFSVLVSLENQEPELFGVLTWDEDYALLGRDVLGRWKATMDGPGQALTISH